MISVIVMLLIGTVLSLFTDQQQPEVVHAILPLLLAGLGAAKGGIDANQARQRQKGLDKFRRTAIAMSPWSGMGDPGAISAGNQSTLGGIIGGGVQGALLGTLGEEAGLLGGAEKTAEVGKVASAGAMAPTTAVAPPISATPPPAAIAAPQAPGLMGQVDQIGQVANPQKQLMDQILRGTGIQNQSPWGGL